MKLKEVILCFIHETKKEQKQKMFVYVCVLFSSSSYFEILFQAKNFGLCLKKKKLKKKRLMNEGGRKKEREREREKKNYDGNS